ncbi:MAG TPA: 12-oxophytodienoate reductase [Sphingomonas sp.]|uniref:oxidoreductase n=1 Tax=Sphingomonas sp. TaxID=28214 RepID=UPI002BC3BC3B|nr:12-oxophytodienoate reductase [Sphingomonas sp.]HMI17979.1 12-oxophytodienoate reductase [Sphingomonas sp.]
MNLTPLFTPFRLRQITLRNRFTVPAMQRGVCENGAPTRALADYYRRRAEGGFSLILSEACAIDHPSAGQEGKVVRMTESTRSAWRMCVDAVGEAGGHMLIQLNHRGGMRREEDSEGPDTPSAILSPSGLVKAGTPGGRAVTPADMQALKASYVRSALIAQEVGAAGVEIHGAHGFLLDQFLWSETNLRDDGYGGPDLRARARFPSEVVAAVRAAAGADFIISYRFSQWKVLDYSNARIARTPDELRLVLGLLRDAGVDLFHVSTRQFNTPEWPEDPRTLAGWTKVLTDAAVMAVGGVGNSGDLQSVRNGLIEQEIAQGDVVRRSLADVLRRFEGREFDLIAVGRASIGDPDWVRKVEAGDFDSIRAFDRQHLLTIIDSANAALRPIHAISS